MKICGKLKCFQENTIQKVKTIFEEITIYKVKKFWGLYNAERWNNVLTKLQCRKLKCFEENTMQKVRIMFWGNYNVESFLKKIWCRKLK